MALTSASTYAEIVAEYLDTLGYDTPPGDTSKCRRFISACRALLVIRPSRASRSASGGSQDFEYDPEVVRMQLEQAQRWLTFSSDANATTGGGISFASFGDFRDT